MSHDVFPAVWPGLVLAALVVAAAGIDRWGRPAAGVVGGLSLIWLGVNGRSEGGVLLVLAPGRGLTAADLAGLAGLGVALWVLVRGRV